MKYSILIFIILTMLLFSCDITGDNSAAGITASPDYTSADISAFTIVRGDTCSEAVTQAAVELRHLLEDITGTKIDIKTDWTKRGTEITRYGREIIIGVTNRPESEALYTEFTHASEPMDYMIRASSGHFIIASSDKAAIDAVKAFAESFIIEDENDMKVNDMINLSVVHDFPVKKFEISGHDISEFSIVYPSSYTEYQKADITLFRDILYTATGKNLDIVSDSEDNNKYKIKIGTAGGESFDGYHPLDYRILTVTDGISIGGNNYYSDIKGIYHFLYDIAGYAYDGSFSKSEVIAANAEYIHYYSDIKILIGAWCTSGDAIETEAQIRDMADAGFNHVNIQVPADKQLMHNLLKWLAIYNLECLWFDGNVYANFTTQDFSEAADYINTPVSWGNYLYDEPNSDKFNQLAEAYALYTDIHGKEPFINLFPMYASETQLGNATYTEHINQYLDTVNPALCSVDIYPLNSYGLYSDYMKNLDIVATAARQRKIPLSVYIQSVSFAESKRTPSYADLEWQAYSCLSFGATGIIYFTYITPYSDAESFKPALIDHEGNKTERWYFAQKLNAELSFISSVFSEYTNLGAYSHNSSSETEFLEFDHQYKDFSAIKAIDCKNPLLIGCFEKDGNYAFTAVNMTNLQQSKGISEVRLKTNSDVVLYKNGESSTLPQDSEGYISLTLDVGEGVFCVVEK
ncbi:MAG: hypothetical protein ACYCWE_12880 [Eubacteriales bacterium]